MNGYHRGLGEKIVAQPVHIAKWTPTGAGSEQIQAAQDGVKWTVDVVKHPAPADDGQCKRGCPGHQHQEPDQTLAGELRRQHQYQDICEYDHDDLRKDREDDRVTERSLEGIVFPDRSEVVESHPVDALVADGYIAQAVEHREYERETDQHEDENDGGKKQERTEHALAVEQVPA